MSERYLSPQEVCEVVPGMTPSLLNQMRFRGDGPPFIAASPRKRVYAESSLHEWLKSRERSSTAQAIAS